MVSSLESAPDVRPVAIFTCVSFSNRTQQEQQWNLLLKTLGPRVKQALARNETDGRSTRLDTNQICKRYVAGTLDGRPGSKRDVAHCHSMLLGFEKLESVFEAMSRCVG